MSREKEYIYHYCLNENLNIKNPDYCDRAWVDVAHGGQRANAPQNWKYCPECVKKGYPDIKAYTKGREIRKNIIMERTGKVFSNKKRVVTDEQKELFKERILNARLKKKAQEEG
jgi:hypothetical protein